MRHFVMILSEPCETVIGTTIGFYHRLREHWQGVECLPGIITTPH